MPTEVTLTRGQKGGSTISSPSSIRRNVPMYAMRSDRGHGPTPGAPVASSAILRTKEGLVNFRRKPRHHLIDPDGERQIVRGVRSLAKLAGRTIVPAPHDRRKVVFIFGCQRSGTTMLQQSFLDPSWRVFILGEHDRRLVGDDPGETELARGLARVHANRRLPFEIVALKPLVESSRALQLTDAAGDARSIWMLRHYGDVARSNIRRFGERNPHRDLECFDSGDPSDWRCRGATDETRETR